jgi:predicted transcriptional regulator
MAKKKSKKKLKKTAVAKGVEARRKQVSVLLKQGHNHTEIAQILGVSRSTVVSDVSAVQGKAVTSIREVVDQPAEMLADSLNVFAEIIEQAEVGFHSTDNPAQKNAFLRTRGEFNKERIKLLMDVGLIPRASTKQDTTLHVIGGVDMNKASLEELAALSRSMEAQAAAKGLDLPSMFGGPKLVDVEVEDEED